MAFGRKRKRAGAAPVAALGMPAATAVAAAVSVAAASLGLTSKPPLHAVAQLQQEHRPGASIKAGENVSWEMEAGD